MYRVNIVDIFRRAVTGMSHIAVPLHFFFSFYEEIPSDRTKVCFSGFCVLWRFLKRFAALPAILTNTVKNRIFALQRKSVVFFNMLCNFIHKRTVQMQNTAAFHAF